MDTPESFFSAFKLAIDEEQKASELYMTLAKMCEETELKKLFEQFAAEELEHKEKLIEKYNELKSQ